MERAILQSALEQAEADLRRVRESIAILIEDEKKLGAFIASTNALLSPKNERGDTVEKVSLSSHKDANDFISTSDVKLAELSARETLRRSERRKEMQRIVLEAVDIIVRTGRPLLASEILKEHSIRDDCKEKWNTDKLYRVLAKRADQKRLLVRREAKFWPIDKPIPR